MEDVGDEDGAVGPTEGVLEGVSRSQWTLSATSDDSRFVSGYTEGVWGVEHRDLELRPRASELHRIDPWPAAQIQDMVRAAEIEALAGGGGRAPSHVGHRAGEIALGTLESRIQLLVVYGRPRLHRVIQPRPTLVESGSVSQKIRPGLSGIWQQMTPGVLTRLVAVCSPLQQAQIDQGIAEDTGASGIGLQVVLRAAGDPWSALPGR